MSHNTMSGGSCGENYNQGETLPQTYVPIGATSYKGFSENFRKYDGPECIKEISEGNFKKLMEVVPKKAQTYKS